MGCLHCASIALRCWRACWLARLKVLPAALPSLPAPPLYRLNRRRPAAVSLGIAAMVVKQQCGEALRRIAAGGRAHGRACRPCMQVPLAYQG